MPSEVRIMNPNDVAIRLEGSDLVLELPQLKLFIRRALAPEILERALSLLVYRDESKSEDQSLARLMQGYINPEPPSI